MEGCSRSRRGRSKLKTLSTTNKLYYHPISLFLSVLANHISALPPPPSPPFSRIGGSAATCDLNFLKISSVYFNFIYDLKFFLAFLLTNFGQNAATCDLYPPSSPPARGGRSRERREEGWCQNMHSVVFFNFTIGLYGIAH